MIEIGFVDGINSFITKLIRLHIISENVIVLLFFYPIGITLTIYLAYIIFLVISKLFKLLFWYMSGWFEYLVDVLNIFMNFPWEYLQLEFVRIFFNTLISQFFEHISLFYHIRILKKLYLIVGIFLALLYFY